MKYCADLVGLQTIAVVPVLVFHAGLGLPGGFIGVDVFFVISGFLITTILWEEMKAGTYSIATFCERRIRWIFPALFAMLALTTLAAAAMMLPYHLDDYGKSLAGATVFLSNVWFYLSTGYFNESAEIKPLLHTWSLAIEEQYYVVFPVLLWAMFRVLGRRAIWGAGGAGAAVAGPVGPGGGSRSRSSLLPAAIPGLGAAHGIASGNRAGRGVARRRSGAPGRGPAPGACRGRRDLLGNADLPAGNAVSGARSDNVRGAGVISLPPAVRSRVAIEV